MPAITAPWCVGRRLDAQTKAATHPDGEQFEPVADLAQEARWFMRWIFPLVAVVICLASAAGCGSLGWYRAAGDIPGIAPTDYAFYDFFGASTQLYPFSPPQVESSAIEALGDLGFRVLEPPSHLPNGQTIIRVRTPDGRPAKIKISPQNNLTSLRVEIGPVHCGDEELSRDFFRRIALNFGTVLRAHTPIDVTLPKRWNMPSGFPPPTEHAPPEELKGEGLRPNENRDQAAAAAEAAAAGQQTSPASGVPGVLQGLMQGGASPLGPLAPYYPGFPYTVPPNPYLPYSLPSNDQ
jgi:hypothetical protein